MIKFTLNGEEVSFSGDPQMPLLWYVRDVLNLTGSKFGCGVGMCGACTDLLGHPSKLSQSTVFFCLFFRQN